MKNGTVLEASKSDTKKNDLRSSSDLGILESIAEKLKQKAVEESDDDLDLNGGIQIKDLLIFCIKTFPGVIIQNRLSLGMQILDKIFNLLAVTLSYGFWKASELEQLGKVLRSAVDSLVKVENIVSEYSSGFSTEDIQKMFQTVRLCRRFITVSVIQIILQYNDAVFISYFNAVGNSFSLKGTPDDQQQNMLPFFSNTQIIKTCSSILINYLLEDKVLMDQKIMGEIERDYLNVLVNLTFHVDREPFILSLENIVASDIKMYKIQFDNLQFLANDSIIAAVSLHNFIDKVLNGGFGVQPQAEKQRFFEEFN